MPRFRGEYTLLFVMPEICRTLYLQLDLATQKRINKEITDELKNKVKVEVLEGWETSEEKITADDDGFRTEEDVRRELDGMVRRLGKGVHLTIPGRDGLILKGSKTPQCGQDFELEYPVHIDEQAQGRSHKPWIIPSRSHPQLVFEVRVAIHWIGPQAYPVKGAETKGQKPAQVGDAAISPPTPPGSKDKPRAGKKPD